MEPEAVDCRYNFMPVALPCAQLLKEVTELDRFD